MIVGRHLHKCIHINIYTNVCMSAGIFKSDIYLLRRNSPRRSHHQRVTEIGTARLRLEEFQVLRRWNFKIRLIREVEAIGGPNQGENAAEQSDVGERLVAGQSAVVVAFVVLLLR